MIAQKSIQEVLAIARTEEIVEDYVSLKRRGINMIGLCPFHNEKTPSFTVSPSKNIYKCFGCGKGGNAVQFLMEHESMSFVETIRTLAGRYGIKLEETEQSDDYKEEKKLIDALYVVNEFAGDYYHTALLNSDEGKSIGLSYLRERGYLLSTIQKFKLGYASRALREFTQEAADKRYNAEHLKILGLTSKSGNDFFRERVLFPIFNLTGKVVGFGGRIMSNNTKAPKYLNSPESDIYNKRNLLYGIFQAKRAIRKEDNCFMVEGYTDVISLHQAGIENVVASSGTSLTENQVRLVKRFTENMTILYDGDTAGIKAALRGLDLVLEQMMNVRIVMLPEGQDPDSFIQEKGNAAFKEYIEKESKDFILFKTSLISEEAGNDPIKKARLIKDIIETLAKIPDTIKRSLYIQQCSEKLNIDEGILVKETNKSIRALISKKKLDSDAKAYRAAREEDQLISEKPDKALHEQKPIELSDDHLEKDLVRLVVNCGNKIYEDSAEVLKVIDVVKAFVIDDLSTFSNLIYRDIIREAIEQHEEHGEVNIDKFIAHDNEEIRSTVITLISTPYTFANWDKVGVTLQTSKMPEDNQRRDTDQALLRYKLHTVSRTIDVLKIEIENQVTNNDEGYVLNLKTLQELQVQRNKIAEELNTIVF